MLKTALMMCCLATVGIHAQAEEKPSELGTKLSEAMLARLRNELRATGIDDADAVQQIASLLGAQQAHTSANGNSVGALPSELLNTLQASQSAPTSSSSCLQQCGILFTADWLTVLRDPAISRLVEQVQPTAAAPTNAQRPNPIQSLLSSLGTFDRDDRQLIVDSMCKVQNSLSRCMSKCSVDVVSQAAVVGMRSTDLMCEDENKNQYVEVLPCLLQVQQTPEALECTVRQQAELAAARNHDTLSTFDQLNAACIAAEEHTQCMREVILKHCHASAATMLSDLSERTVGLSLRLLNNYDGELPQTCSRYQQLGHNATTAATPGATTAKTSRRQSTTTPASFRAGRRAITERPVGAGEMASSTFASADAPVSQAGREALSAYGALFALFVTLLFCADRCFRM